MTRARSHIGYPSNPAITILPEDTPLGNNSRSLVTLQSRQQPSQELHCSPLPPTPSWMKTRLRRFFTPLLLVSHLLEGVCSGVFQFEFVFLNPLSSSQISLLPPGDRYLHTPAVYVVRDCKDFFAGACVLICFPLAVCLLLLLLLSLSPSPSPPPSLYPRRRVHSVLSLATP